MGIFSNKALKYLIASSCIFALLFGLYHISPRIFTVQNSVHDHSICVRNAGDKPIKSVEFRNKNDVLYKNPNANLKAGDSTCYSFESLNALSAPLIMHIQIVGRNYEKQIDLSRYDVGSIEAQITVGPQGAIPEIYVRNNYGETSYAGLPYYKIFLLFAVAFAALTLCLMFLGYCLKLLSPVFQKK
ncbi:MAG: hypothetical protein EYC62_01840 [Alphaproteobacteria bacterium]|nr:MAG: hypothetical protein EYC62_01840 [Alphaproteobacteria bacterium]